MTGTKENYLNYRIAKSKEVFEDAILLASNNRWNSCVNRLYYSSYHLASALLFKNNFKAETHNGIKTQLFLHYVKTGKLNIELGKVYSHLFDWRQESDYADFIEFDKDIVEPLIKDVETLNLAIKQLINI